MKANTCARFGHLISCTLVIGLLIILLNASTALSAQVTLSWDANDPAPDGYRLFQRTEGGVYNYDAPVWSGTTTSGTASNLADSTTYYFVVRAYIDTTESGDSNEVSYRYDPPPPQTYTINASAGSNGSITPSGSQSLQAGDSQTFSITPDASYNIADVLVDGVSVGAVATYTFTDINADHTISADFAIDAIETFAISATAGANGAISPSGTISVDHGASQSFTCSADSGYHVADVLVDGQSIGPATTYTFTNVSSNHSISAVFEVTTYLVQAEAGTGGTITPAGQFQVAEGASQTFSITADTGYTIDDVLVDGTSVGAIETYHLNTIVADHTIEARFRLSNLAPTADAGPDQTVDENQVVNLSGLNSFDPDDGITTFSWRQVQGPTVLLSTPGEPETSFVAPDVGVEGQSLVFELEVTDAGNKTATDTCIVNVTWVNIPPVADAGADQTVKEGMLVTLDGANSVDTDDGLASYQWIQLQGPAVELANAQSAAASFTAPNVDTQGASLLFQLTVSDNGGLQDTDSCIVTVSWINAPPTADAGPDQQVVEGAEVMLDGSNSTDADDGIASYHWQQTDGPPVTLSDSTAVQPLFTAPYASEQGGTLAFTLTVVDTSGLQHSDSCTVTIVQQNQPPVASAGADQTVAEGSLVTLDGSASTDPDDGLASYHWTQTSGPVVALSNPGAKQPTFTAPDVGSEGASLTFQLTVSDFGGLKAQDTSVVNVTWQNQPPVAIAGGDQQTEPGKTATLDGSASYDVDDGIKTYRWKQISGSPVTLADSTAAVTTYQATEAAADSSLSFELTVTDVGGLLAVDTCHTYVAAISADTTPPTLSITDPADSFVITRKNKISLQGTAGDDRGLLRVQWSSDQGESGTAEGTANWKIVDVRLQRGMNYITVTAYDTAGNSQSATVSVFVGIWR